MNSIIKFLIDFNFSEKAFLAIRILCILVPSQNKKGKRATRVQSHELEKYMFNSFKVNNLLTSTNFFLHNN